MANSVKIIWDWYFPYVNIYTLNSTSSMISGLLQFSVSSWVGLGYCTGIPHLIVLFFIMLCRYCVFLQIEGLCQSCLEQVYWLHFSNNIVLLCISVSHFGNSCNISNIFIIIICVIVLCDQWSLMLLLWLTEASDDG